MSAELTAPALQDGDRLDIFDGDGIWNVEQVLRPPTPEPVEVTCVQRGAKARQRADCSLSHAHVDCQVLGEDRYVARWPALLTGRAPRSAQGSHNLRLAGRLLVDFLDKVEFKERCRCCVEKSNATAYQSDEEARSMLKKLKKKNKSKWEVRLKNLKNLALSTELLSMCDAQEDFPEFEEGTLCVQLKTNCTRPTAEVRKEMGEEGKPRLPLLPDGSNSDSGNITEKTGSSPAKSGQTSHDRATSSSPGAGKDDASSVFKESKEPKDVTVAPENPEIPTQKPVNFRKRARSHDEEESSSSTDSCRAGKTKASRQEPQESQSTAAKETLSTDSDQTGKTKAPPPAKRNQKPKPAAKEVHVSPRKYVKTPKVLKSQRTRSANLPPYTPPHPRLLLKAKPGDEKNVTRANIPNQARDVPCANTAKSDVADKHLPPTDQQETSAAVKRNVTSESKAVEESTSPMKNLARLTKATVRADEQLQNVETALESKLTELAEKSAKAEGLRNKYAALKIRVLSPPRAPASPPPHTHIPQEDMSHERNQTHSSTSIPLRVAQKVRKESTRREKNANGRPGDTRSSTLARRSSPAKCGIRGLELVLDDLLAKDLSHRLSATTTTAELDAIKAELLASPKVHFSDVLRLEETGEEAFGLTPHCTIMNTAQHVSQPAPVVVVEHRIEGNLKPGMVIASMATDPHRLGFYF
ncbi:hypothetical protein GN958_ATG07061 [Phytophthora infestans]|uniref:Uncharacterized protein n=1 Tax=Phytophthora infestans TaxID=4787 RepID=A0A8S9UTH4_PHYIN|nr:hypothetical protein GN958_ATG07061 [Phytophthora infestans]